MRYKAFGKHTGLRVSELVLGTGEMADSQRAYLPIPEYGKPEDIAATVALVAGPEGGFINGAVLGVDGGFTT
jgi:3-oxoacyl-[acyl-carrier protein] reductase